MLNTLFSLMHLFLQFVSKQSATETQLKPNLTLTPNSTRTAAAPRALSQRSVSSVGLLVGTVSLVLCWFLGLFGGYTGSGGLLFRVLSVWTWLPHHAYLGTTLESLLPRRLPLHLSHQG